MKIKVYPNHEDVSRATAELIAEQARQAVSDHDRFSIALSGGSTPQRSYEILAEEPLCSQVPWDKVHVFWGDERMVPDNDERNNAFMARRWLLDKVPIPDVNVHPINTALNPMLAAQQYEVALRNFFGHNGPFLDLILLGLGENGHTASLFPGMPALEEVQYWTADVYIPSQEIHRVTLTAPFINNSKTAVFEVSGEDKAWVLRAVLEGEQDYRALPAQLIHPLSGDLIWMVDESAASMLAERTQTEGD